MISILTPAHRILPWHNLRLINVCSQDFDDWEWLILDNSKDGIVKDYVDRFFTEMQGVYYPHCREKVKVLHEPKFADIPFKDGKLGLMCNYLVGNASCSDNGFFVRLDYDDFFFDGFLKMVDAAIRMNPDTEFVTGAVSNDLVETDSGHFLTEDCGGLWGECVFNEMRHMINNGWNNVDGFSEWANDMLMLNKWNRITEKRNSSLSIPYTTFIFNVDCAYVLKDGWGILDVPEHPMCIKKGAFLSKFGGFATFTSREDTLSALYPIAFENPLYIDNLCYLRCVLVDNNGIRKSGTNEVLSERNAEYESAILLDMWRRKYEKLGFRNKIIPKHIKF